MADDNVARVARVPRLGRRRFVAGLAACAAALGCASLWAQSRAWAEQGLAGALSSRNELLPSAPRLPSDAQVDQAFSKRSAEAVLDTLFPNGRPPRAAPGAIALSLPEIAEDGSVVPLTLEFDGPCYGLVLIAAGNPVPLVLATEFPEGVLSPFRTRIRLAGSTAVTAVVFGTQGPMLAGRAVEVARGGCVQQAPADAQP